MAFGVAFAGLSLPMAAALAGTGALALTALYLLRRRVTRVVVPFVWLWLSVGRDGAAHRLGRRLRRWLSLALQIVILALVVLAAGDPRPATDGGQGRTLVLLIDRSASMQALDEPGSRLNRARALANGIIDGLGPSDRALVASFAADVTAATGLEDDRRRLKAAVDAIGPSDEPGDLAGALAFSAAVLRGRARPTLILISDGGGAAGASSGAFGGGGGADADGSAGLDGIDRQFMPVGKRRDNLAIVAFSARRLPLDPSSVELGLVAQSFRDVPAQVTVAVTAGPARIPVVRRTLRLAPGQRVVERWSGVALPDPRLEAVLEDARDDLPLDDRAFAVVPEGAPLRVLTIGGANLYLEGALLGLAATVEVAHVPANAVETTRGRWSGYDAVIFDGVTPDPPPLAGHFLYLDPHGPGSPWPDRGTVADPIVTQVANDHPLVKQLSLVDLNIAVARILTPGKNDVAVVSAPHAPLVLAGAHANLRRVAVAFDPRRSDLPLRSAFPLFLANALDWLASQPMSEALSWPTGRTVHIDIATPGPSSSSSLSSPFRTQTIRVVSPDGTTADAPVVSGGVTVALSRTGIFEVVGGQGPNQNVIARVAANLASPSESDVAPRAMPRFAHGQQIVSDGDGRARSRRREPWIVALLAALLLGTCEWLTFHRRLTV